MVLIGKQSFVFSHSGKYADVKAFAKEVKGLPEVPIVDDVIAYYCTFLGETYLLVVRNTLCVPTININMITPFVFRETGLILIDTHNIHYEYPSVEA